MRPAWQGPQAANLVLAPERTATNRSKIFRRAVWFLLTCWNARFST
jgi:hypothetical protein